MGIFSTIQNMFDQKYIETASVKAEITIGKWTGVSGALGL